MLKHRFHRSLSFPCHRSLHKHNIPLPPFRIIGTKYPWNFASFDFMTNFAFLGDVIMPQPNIHLTFSDANGKFFGPFLYEPTGLEPPDNFFPKFGFGLRFALVVIWEHHDYFKRMRFLEIPENLKINSTTDVGLLLSVFQVCSSSP